jgi:hypothetical protein
MSDSSQSIPLGQLESSPAASFEKIGDKHIGKIVSMDHRQQTDPKDGTRKFFTSGDPMMLWVITIETPEGVTNALWAKGGRFEAAEGSGDSMLNAITTAVKAAGAGSLDVGAQLAVQFTGTSKPKPGMNPAKLFTAQYQPPAPASVPVDLFSPSPAPTASQAAVAAE